MIASGHWQIADLAGRFVKEGSREIDSIISTARTQTQWLLSEPMRGDLCKNGIGDWARLLDRPTTCFVIVPAEFLETQEGSVWLRLVILSALRALYARAGRRKVKTVVFMLSEFAQLGKLSSIETARSQGRKYGVRLFLVLQDIHQLRTQAMYGPQGHESFAGQCGGVFAFAPGDSDSAEWMSRRSDEEDVPVRSVSQSEQGRSENWSLQRQRCWPPGSILGLPKYHGLLWLHGQSRAVPVYAEPYIDDRGNIRPEYLRAGARPDPYHSGDDGGDDDDEGDDFAGIGGTVAGPEVAAVAAPSPSRRLVKAGAAVAFAVLAAFALLAFKGHDWTVQPVGAQPPAPVHHQPTQQQHPQKRHSTH